MITPGCNSAGGSHDPPFTPTTWWLGFVYLVPRYHFNRRLITRSTSSNRKKHDQYHHFFRRQAIFFNKKIFNQSSFPPSNLLLCLGDHSPDRHIFSVWMECLDQSLHLQGNIKMFGEDWRYETPFLHNSEVYSMKRLQLKMLLFLGKLEFG